MSYPSGRTCGQTTGETMGETTDRWMDLKEAAEALGVTSEAVRKRVRRGTLESQKGEDGRLFVRMDTGSDIRPDGGYDERVGHGYDELLKELRNRVGSLENQLAEEREANRENRRIIAGLVQRVPELEPARESAPEARESPVSASEEEGRGEEETPADTKRQSWWQRWFGG